MILTTVPQKVFLLDNYGRIIGTSNYIRMPRKLKKVQKKKAIFQLKHIQGFDFNHIFYDTDIRATKTL